MPVDLLIFPADVSHDLESPNLVVCVGKPQAFKRNSDLYGITLLIHTGIRQKICIPIFIDPVKAHSSPAAPDLCINSIGLHTAGSGLKSKCALFVIDCIQLNRDAVIPINLVSLS